MFKINSKYTRKSIGEKLGISTKGGSWTTGYAPFKDKLFLFIGIECSGKTGHNYNNKFIESDILEWHAKNCTTIHQPVIQKIIKNEVQILLFIRFDNKNTEFKYVGLGKYVKYFDETPVRFHFDYEGRQNDSNKIDNVQVDQGTSDNIGDLSITEKEYIIKSRLGHSKLKKEIFSLEKKCQLCLVDKQELLIASHIKPWCKSSSVERTDVNNVFLLCPHHDALFDKGFISFKDNGDILISDNIDTKNRTFLNINQSMKINIKEKQTKYLKYHRENILKK